MSKPSHVRRCSIRRRLIARRGFNLVELLIALAISAALLTATMVALNASFTAYQMTTEVASTHTIGRLTIERMQALIRTGTDFGPFPVNPRHTIFKRGKGSYGTRAPVTFHTDHCCPMLGKFSANLRSGGRPGKVDDLDPFKYLFSHFLLPFSVLSDRGWSDDIVRLQNR